MKSLVNVCLCFGLIIFCAHAFANEVEIHDDFNYDEFCLRSVGEQLNIVKKAFNERIRKSKNIRFRYELRMDTRDSVNGKLIGTPYEKVSISYHQLQDSYIADIELFRPGNDAPDQKTIIFWDAKNGILKNSSIIDEKIYGRIDTVIDPFISINDCYATWGSAGASDQKNYPYLFPYLMDNQNSWAIRVSAEKKEIELSVDYNPKYNLKNLTGKWTLMLDPNKDFLPIKGKMRWDGATESGENIWREENFIIIESKLFDTLWMPSHLEETIQASSAPPNYMSITNIHLNELEFGSVKNKDMEYIFPENAMVVDAINGISYIADVNGNPIDSHTKPLYGLDPSRVKMPGQKPNRTLNYIFVVLGLLMMGGGAYLYFEKRRRNA